MPQWKPIIGMGFDTISFDIYCKALTWTAWRPSFIVVHNTAIPNLSQRPQGFTRQHMQNLVAYYRDQKGWSAGPHRGRRSPRAARPTRGRHARSCGIPTAA